MTEDRAEYLTAETAGSGETAKQAARRRVTNAAVERAYTSAVRAFTELDDRLKHVERLTIWNTVADVAAVLILIVMAVVLLAL